MAKHVADNRISSAGDYRRTNQRYSAKARKGGPWRVVFWVALAVLVVSLACLGYIAYTYWSGQRAYDDIAADSFSIPEDVSGMTLADFEVDWDALRAINPDVVGWVYVPGTTVSYPIAHRDGDDAYYLKHNFAGSTTGQFGAEYGCIMLSGENDADFSDQVNIIYGHNLTNGSMFAQLAEFANTDVFNEHRTIYVLTPTGNYRLSTFAINRVSGSDTTVVVPNPGSASELSAYVQKRLDDSLVEPDPAAPEAAEVGKVFAFSTCDHADNTYRFVTFAQVEEYLPTGASASSGDYSINPDDVSSVDDTVKGRVS